MKTKALTISALLIFSSSLLISANKNVGDNSKIPKKEITFYAEKPQLITLDELPRKAKTIEFNNEKLFFYNGNYYRLVEDKFNMTLPPIGLHVKDIPDNYERIIKNGQVVYFANGVYFYKDSNSKGFVVGKGLVGVQISKLPENTVKAKLKNSDCFVYYNTVYKKSNSRSRESYAFVGYIED